MNSKKIIKPLRAATPALILLLMAATPKPDPCLSVVDAVETKKIHLEQLLSPLKDLLLVRENKKLTNGQSVQVYNDTQTNQSYHLDVDAVDEKGNAVLSLWGPEAPKKLNWEAAKKYCKDLKDLGLDWRLPSEEDFLRAFNRSNKEKAGNPFLIKAIPAMDHFGKSFWSMSFEQSLEVEGKTYFGESGEIDSDPTYIKNWVRCIGVARS